MTKSSPLPPIPPRPTHIIIDSQGTKKPVKQVIEADPLPYQTRSTADDDDHWGTNPDRGWILAVKVLIIFNGAALFAVLTSELLHYIKS